MLVVLAIGSTAPGLLQFIIGRFAQVFPDYRERVLRHEAAHFLVSPLHAHWCLAALLKVNQLHLEVSAKLRTSWIFCAGCSECGLQAGYLMRVPVAGYSLDIGKAHTDFAEAKLQQRLVERKLSDEEINQLAVVAMAGATAEAMNYEQACMQQAHQQHAMVTFATDS